MSKRTFENADEGKFWEVWIDGANVFTRHGKLGASGQTKLKPGDAAVMDKMIKEKIVAGYVQTGGEVQKGPELDKKELKRHLSGLKPLTDDPAYLVLADWLQQQNHPWGELIVLQHGAATNPKKAASLKKQADKHLKENGPVILGEAANDKASHFDWHHGFVRRAVVGTPADVKSITKNVKSFLDSPVAHMLETLVIAPYPAKFTTYRDWDNSHKNLVDPWTELDKIAKLIPDRITRLGFGGWPAMAAAGYVHMPSFSKLSTAFPKLTALELTGWLGDKPTKLSLSHCTDLAVRFAMGTSAHIKALATSKLPKLERLTVWLGGSVHGIVDEVFEPDEIDYDDDDDGDELRYPETYTAADLEAMTGYNDPDCEVRAEGLEPLLASNFGITHFGIGMPQWDDEMLAAVIKSKLVKKLKTLSISGGKLNKDLAKVLGDAKKSLEHLEAIEITCQLEDDAGKKLAPLKNAKLAPVEDRENFSFRYIATME